MPAIRKENAFLIVSALLVAGSAGAFGTLAWRNAGAPQGPGVQVHLTDTPYTPSAKDATVVKADTWLAPSFQSKGKDWVYDTFTPPEIFYSARTKKFTVKPPANLVEEVVEEAFGIELVSVRQEPFRLQLIGFAGDGGEARGVFQNLASGEVFLGGAGQRVPALKLTIKSLVVEYQPITAANSMTTRQKVATAVVRDDVTGRDLTITHRDRAFTGNLTAYLAEPGATATREVHEGDTMKVGEASYRVVKIVLTPPSIEISKESPTLSQPDQRVLSPRESDDATPTPETPADRT